MVEVYQTFLKVGKAKKTCQACNRHMDDRELAVFEKYVRWRSLPGSLKSKLIAFAAYSSTSKSERALLRSYNRKLPNSRNGKERCPDWRDSCPTKRQGTE